MEAQRAASEAFAKQQAEAYQQFTANAPQAPRNAMPAFQAPEFPPFQSREEVIKQMEARRASVQKQMDARRAEFEKAGKSI